MLPRRGQVKRNGRLYYGGKQSFTTLTEKLPQKRTLTTGRSSLNCSTICLTEFFEGSLSPRDVGWSLFHLYSPPKERPMKSRENRSLMPDALWLHKQTKNLVNILCNVIRTQNFQLHTVFSTVFLNFWNASNPCLQNTSNSLRTQMWQRIDSLYLNDDISEVSGSGLVKSWWKGFWFLGSEKSYWHTHNPSPQRLSGKTFSDYRFSCTLFLNRSECTNSNKFSALETLVGNGKRAWLLSR